MLAHRYNKRPKIPMHRIENITLALEAIRRERIKLVNVGLGICCARYGPQRLNGFGLCVLARYCGYH